jgi:uncharacterized protein YhaN
MSPHHIEKLANQVAELSARLAEAEKKIAALEKSTPPHLARIERRSS